MSKNKVTLGDMQLKEDNWKKLNFSVPISFSAGDSTKPETFLIQGTAINAVLTRNGVEFVAEELEASAKSLRNKPILKDHINSVDSIVGRTTQNVHFNNDKIDFEAMIPDEATQMKIRQGLITNVSVGAMVQNLEEVSDKEGNVTHVIARGVDFVELSLVAVPADPGAGLAQAIQASFDLKQKQEVKTTSTVQKMDTKETNQEKTEAKETSQTTNDTILSLLKDMGTKIDSQGAELAKLKEVKEASVTAPEVKETVKEEVKVDFKADETKGAVPEVKAEAKEETSDNFKIFNQGKDSYMCLDSYEGQGLSRLSRSGDNE